MYFCGGLFGFVTSIVATALGFHIWTLEYWGVFLLSEIPFIVGYAIGRRQ